MLSPYQECPVPENQQPRNEYYILQKSYLFGFTILPISNYAIELVKIAIIVILLASPFILTNTDICNNPLYFLSISNTFSTLVLILILTRTYLGWSYISKRLLSATIVYEESGWYDIQVWIKSPIDLAQDRLIAEYTIKPILLRIRYTTQLLLVYILVLQLYNNLS
uniref:hypothetical protein n=1 Tax=Goniotrichopsis reniformis TaxID=468933 RepID=UPI001FCCC2DA|nr:hypothetical protein MW428_pgp069 [Goniotrichopsis reniformis]UNJ14829.1 hypothetical protein [Goniotrichopsis reniformis]